MNDFIEFVTWPTHQNLFHKINTQALVFYVKGQQNAAIGLTAKSGSQCRHWIILGQAECRMVEDDEQVCNASTPDILSVREYRRFWLSWYGNVLRFGQDKNSKAILFRKIAKEEVSFVTFVGEANKLYWKCLIPSPILNLPLAKFNEGKAYWTKVDSQLPDDAVIGGFENEPLYIVRSHHRSSLTPGKFVPSEGIGYISWGRAAHPKPGEDLEVLCGYNMIWENAKGNIIPTGSVKGGYSEVNHEILYVGRVQHKGHVIPGKVQPSHKMSEPAQSGTDTEYAPSEMPVSVEGGAPSAVGGFPPYPPYVTVPAPPSVADTILAGRTLRVQHKLTLKKKPVRPPPKPAKPRGPKATDVKLSKRAARAHARCLRRHGAVLTDRLERMAKPLRRNIIFLWREHADILPADTIARLRAMLDADEPFKPDQAYEYFVNLRKTKKKTANTRGVNQIKKDMQVMYGDKRFVWARNATVAFARGIQQRLSRPGAYALADGMLRLSNIILEDLCSYMHTKTPSRRCRHPKAKFMMEMSDKVAVWIDEILSESDDRMLMMDFDEDEDVLGAGETGNVGFTDDFLNMMGDGGLLKGPQSAYLKFTGEMLEAFMILTDSMSQKGDEEMLSHGKFKQTYLEGADQLKKATDFEATEYNSKLANQLKNDLAAVAEPNTPNNIAPYMKEMVDICSNYLAQYAEFNKDKGMAFRLLIKAMRAKGNDQLYQKGKARRTYGKAAKELDEARGLENDHDDPNLSQEIHSNLSKLTEKQTPPDLKTDMAETLDMCSKYLSQCAVDEIERGPAFDILIKELEKHGADKFTPQFEAVLTKFAAAYTLKSAPGLCGVTPDPSTSPIFLSALHAAVDPVTPKDLTQDMNGVIERCANYLSAFVRDRNKALQSLLKMMKSNPNKEVAKRNNYTMDYGTGATEIETAPVIVPFMPIKDIAEEGKANLSKDMEKSTLPELRLAMKALIQDAARYLSQPIAIRSGVAGERYPLNFLAAVKKSLGSRPLFKFKSYGQTYSDGAEVLKYSGPLKYDPKAENLKHEIASEMNRGVPSRLAPTIASSIGGAMDDASKHLAKVGYEKGEALQHLVNLMKEEGDAPLGQIQGYQQSYKDGARRIENSNSLTSEKVDKSIYESLRGKLSNLVQKKPAPDFVQLMPEIVDESSKFLATPLPESEEEKRRLLADLMARKDNEILDKEGLYKITYTEGGEEIMKAPMGAVQAKNETKKQEMLHKVNSVIPEKKLQEMLKGPANEGSAYLAEIVKGRGEAMQVLHDGMQKDKDKEFITIGKFSKTNGQAAEMLENADHFGGKRPAPVLVDKVEESMKKISTAGASEKAKLYLPETTEITTNYIAGVVAEECGLDAKALAELDKGKMGVPQKDGARVPSTSALGGPPGSSDDMDDVQRGRLAEDAARKEAERRPLTLEAERRPLALEAERKRHAMEAEKRRREGLEMEYDPERERAQQILDQQLRARGGEILYQQPHAELTHKQAADWLAMKPPMKIDKSVKESGDTARLHKKFERKLSNLVSKHTPDELYDAMQDVVIESSRIISENFVSKSYKALVQVALISEMQKRGNEILIEVEGAAETFFFAAQRLKKAKSLEANEPCSQVAYTLTKKLEDIIRCRSMARKLTSAMKDHIKEAADFLSAHVTKPDEEIEAYVALLSEMETAGDSLLIEGAIPKSYKDAAAYLRQLTSYEDQICQPNATLQSTTERKLKTLMANDIDRGFFKNVINDVISDSTGLLVSYIVLQGIKTEALKVLVERMDIANNNVLLRHGTVRKTFSDGADILRLKNTDQLSVPSADPVVARKIQIKLRNLMYSCTPDKYKEFMDDVIEDATMYLAVHFLQPRLIKVCKCMKNVFVQCELWCDEILRRVARPCCTCSRHVSAQALGELAPCPSRQPCPPRQPCPASAPSDDCPGASATTSYFLYSTEPSHPHFRGTGRVPFQSASDTHKTYTRRPPLPRFRTPIISPARSIARILSEDIPILERRGDTPTLSDNLHEVEASSPSYHTPVSQNSDSPTSKPEAQFWQAPTTMYAQVHSKVDTSDSSVTRAPRLVSVARRVYNASIYRFGAPIVTTDEMGDWHAMMVSLMWNVQAWRDWIQENVDRGINYQSQPDLTPGEAEMAWNTFQRRISTEALQWRQYNIFSRQLTLRLAIRYSDKRIVSPTRATVKTDTYMDYQKEMLDIIEMFHRWTQWLIVVIKETDDLKRQSDTELPLHETRWRYFKTKVEEYFKDWTKYNTHLKSCWEEKYKTLIADWLPVWGEAGPVWVVSACGAVPSGAVAAGVYEGEVIWLARTTHKCNVLPAALHPSKHSCVVYGDGGVHQYTKYQVMCNANVSWVAWRAENVVEGVEGASGVASVAGGSGSAGGGRARAVRASPGVLIGRVHYRGSHLVGAVHAPANRCHVVIFGRSFAFNCYELLMLTQEER